MKEHIIKSLEQSKFASKYILLCNEYMDVDKGITPKKDELLAILNNLSVSLKFSTQEKLFYKDYDINGNSVRFILPFKYGFIDCSYTIWNNLKGFRFGGSYADFSKMIDENFENKVAYKFPIATSLDGLEAIIKQVLELHSDFLKYYETNSTED